MVAQWVALRPLLDIYAQETSYMEDIDVVYAGDYRGSASDHTVRGITWWPNKSEGMERGSGSPVLKVQVSYGQRDSANIQLD